MAVLSKLLLGRVDHSIIRDNEGWTGDNCREDKDHSNSVYNEQQYNVLSQVGSLPLQVPLAPQVLVLLQLILYPFIHEYVAVLMKVVGDA